MLDLIIVGAGPAGIAVALAAQRARLQFVLLDKGALCNTIYHFPSHMRFFSTADLLEFPGIPLAVEGDKPRAFEVLNYFTRIALSTNLPLRTYENVHSIARQTDHFFVQATKANYRARTVVLATGTYDHPNRLGIPGEDLPHVSHYYSGPHPYAARRVIVVGGKNSAAEAALELYRRGAHVMMVHRADSLREASIKYWILPDLRNRLDEGAIDFRWNSTVQCIEAERLQIETHGQREWLNADAVLLLTGYQPDYSLLEQIGVQSQGERRVPLHDPATLETNVPGAYIAGVLSAGADPSKVFIENARHHGELIINHIVAKA
jgi:thioredoxin reductase (NADPH)